MNLPLIHYSSRPLLRKPKSTKQDHGEGNIEGRGKGSGIFMKPHGFWFSAGDGEDSWRAWSEDERFNIWNLLHKTEIILADNANVLWIKSVEEIDAFHAEYNSPHDFERDMMFYEGGRTMNIDWRRVAAKYDGIIIAPYLWARRLEGPTLWYYSWDCASGCIWNADAIAGIRPYDSGFMTVARRALRYAYVTVRELPSVWRMNKYRRNMRAGRSPFRDFDKEWPWMLPPVMTPRPAPERIPVKGMLAPANPTERITLAAGDQKFDVLVPPSLAGPMRGLFKTINKMYRRGS